MNATRPSVTGSPVVEMTAVAELAFASDLEWLGCDVAGVFGAMGREVLAVSGAGTTGDCQDGGAGQCGCDDRFLQHVSFLCLLPCGGYVDVDKRQFGTGMFQLDVCNGRKTFRLFRWCEAAHKDADSSLNLMLWACWIAEGLANGKALSGA